MKFVSDQIQFSLRIQGYEFPDCESGRWDRNWLLVEISAATEQGQWVAHDPCLLSWDILRLATWLENDDSPGFEHPIVFLEPELSFARGGDVLRVYLRWGFCPPWFTKVDRDSEPFQLDLRVSASDRQRAADSLRKQYLAYPERGRLNEMQES